MDGSSLTTDIRYAFLDKQIADNIDQLPPALLKALLEVLATIDGCKCGCRGRNHLQEISDAVTRLRNYANIRWIAAE
jgi:hypothetical protein